MDGEIKIDGSFKDLDIKKTEFKKTDSVIISWSFEEGEEGIVIVGHKDPLGIFQRIIPIEAYSGQEGLDFLTKIGIDRLAD